MTQPLHISIILPDALAYIYERNKRYTVQTEARSKRLRKAYARRSFGIYIRKSPAAGSTT